jgi:TolB-like protein/predicted Zn-dependent protease
MMCYYTFIEGHPEHAASAIEQAIAQEPQNLMHKLSRALHLSCFGQYEEALREYRELPAEKIQLEDYSRVLIAVGDLAGAREMSSRVQQLRPNTLTQCRLAEIHARLGATEEARKLIRELETQAEQGRHIPFAHIAAAYGALGELENARRWLRKGLVEGRGSWSMLELRTAFRLDMFGKFPWYWEIIDAMNFPPRQMDSPFFALEQAMRYGRGKVDTTTTRTNEAPKTLAVLPFVNMSLDKDNEYLSDGITEELLNTLARLPGLRVPGRASSFYFKGKNETVRRIGEELKVAAVLEGSVRKAGDQLRITAQLTRTTDGFQLWATNYDRKAEDILAIQSEVAQRVLDALKVKLTGPAGQPAAKPRTENLQAYESYLKGLLQMYKYTEPELRQAIAHFQRALEQQPDYALAYAGLSLAFGNLRFYGYVPPADMTPQLRAAAAKALELDDTLATAHFARAHVATFVDWDWAPAERGYQRAIELDPANVLPPSFYGFLLALTGRHQESIDIASKALELDPLSALIHVNAGFMHHFAKDYDRAIEYGRKGSALAPDYFFAHQLIGASLFRQGQREEGIAELETAVRLSPVPQALATLGWMYGRAGRKPDAQRVLDQFLA